MTITPDQLQTLVAWADAYRAYMVHFGACDDCDSVLCEEGMRLDARAAVCRYAAYYVVRSLQQAQADGWRSTVGMFDGDEDMQKVLRATDSPAAAGERLTDARSGYADARCPRCGNFFDSRGWYLRVCRRCAEQMKNEPGITLDDCAEAANAAEVARGEGSEAP